MSRLKFNMLFDLPFSHSFSYLSWIYWLFENIIWYTSHLEDPEVKRRYMEPWTSHGMSRLKFEILFDHTFYHSLSYFFIKVMIIWTYTFKFKSYGGPYILKKVYMDPWTSLSMSRLKSKMLFYLTFSHSFSYLSWRSWWFENILSSTRHLEDP